MKTTQEYFNKTVSELVENWNEEGYTKEECLLFDDGLKVIFFDDEAELENEKEEIEKYCKLYGYEIKEKVLTVNERIAMILI